MGIGKGSTNFAPYSAEVSMNWVKCTILINILGLACTPLWAQTGVKVVRVNGSSYHAGTGADLSAKVSILENKKRTKLGETNEKGRFDFRVPATTNALVFEAKGFHPVSIPVHFIGIIEPEYVFTMSVPMAPKEAAADKIANQLYMAFNRRDTTTITYEVQFGKDLSMVSRFTSKEFKGASSFVLRDARPGEYVIAACTSDGFLLFQERFVMEPGVNFKALGVKGMVYRKPVLEEKTPAPTEIQTIYFDQSSYELRSDNKPALDIIASSLLKHPDWKIRITGYTDNVGPRQPNVVLSEYRAKIVAGYLRQKGIPDEQMLLEWKGPDRAVTPNEDEASRVKNRRVELQLVD